MRYCGSLPSATCGCSSCSGGRAVLHQPHLSALLQRRAFRAQAESQAACGWHVCVDPVESKPNARWVKFHGRSVLMHDCFSDRRRALIAALLDILAGTMTKSR